MMKMFKTGLLAASVLLAGTSNAVAQLSAGGGAIEITADRFELDDIRQEAIYRGNVDVIQGLSRIRAEEVIVRYRSKEEQQAEIAAGNETVGAVKEIDATGDVYYVTPTEKVKADKGLYSADREIITLSGDVRVTNVDGVIAGSHLVIDITKGRYIMDGGGDGGRVRSVFDNATDVPSIQ